MTGRGYNIKVRTVFLGTADFACPALEQLIAHADIEVVALITQPDKPVGRKQIITPPPPKVIAAKHGIKVYQPEKISQDLVLVEELRALKPDFLVTAAYGQILKQNVLDIAPVVNLHASLLPKYRGAAPINWMIIHGEREVGVTTMLSDAGIDTGMVLLKSSTILGENENALELTERLAMMGAELLVETLVSFKSITPLVQDASQVPPGQLLAPFMDRKLGAIDFMATEMVLGSANPRQADFRVVLANNAENIHNLVRGTYPWPGAYFMHDGKKISVLETAMVPSHSEAFSVHHDATKDTSSRTAERRGDPHAITDGLLRRSAPRNDLKFTVNKQEESLMVSCYDGSLLRVLKVKPEGRNEMTAAAWFNGITSH